MNTSILRLATKSKRGVRYWSIPGFSNAAKFLPASQSMWKAQAVYWPAIDAKGELIKGARLDLHKTIVRQEITNILMSCGAKQ